jgi:hypothetical protein
MEIYYGFWRSATITTIYPLIIISGDRIEAQLFPSGLVWVSKKKPMNIEVSPTINVIFFREAGFCVWGERLFGFPTVSDCSLFAGIRH